jgi:hypothetical protein
MEQRFLESMAERETPVSDPGPWTGRYSVESLMEYAIRFARNPSQTPRPRWAIVRDMFGVGSTMATKLCERFGLDPHEDRPGMTCEACAQRVVEEA